MSIALTFVLVIVGLALGGGLGWLARGSQAPAHPAPLTRSYAPPPPPAQPSESRLIGALISVHDLGDGVAVRPQIQEDLGQVGVHLLDTAPGTPFDSARHKAVHAIPATTPGQIGTIAAQVRPGWAGPSGIIRFPEVSVYSASALA